MAAAEPSVFFTPDFEARLETAAGAAIRAGRKVNACTAGWHLFLAPVLLFLGAYIGRGRFMDGYAGFRASVHAAVFHFAVNARVYELTHADTAELEKIKKEFE